MRQRAVPRLTACNPAASLPHAPSSYLRSQRRASAIQWNPDIATQLIVASDDDRSPTLQMWDLRNSVSPLKEFVGHHKVCPQDCAFGRAPRPRLFLGDPVRILT